MSVLLIVAGLLLLWALYRNDKLAKELDAWHEWYLSPNDDTTDPPLRPDWSPYV